VLGERTLAARLGQRILNVPISTHEKRSYNERWVMMYLSPTYLATTTVL
jgi:hypothetical protein